MNPVQEPITGKEAQEDLSSPYQALVQFYRAFNSRNMQLMAENWLQSEEIAMDNPLGGIKRGWGEIQAVYQRIFNGPSEVYVEFFDYTIHQSTEMCYVVGREQGYFHLGSEEINLAIRTSRIFRKLDDCWRQVHHHGSIDDAQLLAMYQKAVLERM